MKILQYFTNGKWTSLYQDAWNLCLNKRKNLSDLENKDEARKNLGLVGDKNNTHFHDDRYLKLGEKENILGHVDKEVSDLKVDIGRIDEDIQNKIIIQDTAPQNPKVNQVWICSLKDKPGVNIYNDNTWISTNIGQITKVPIYYSDWTSSGSTYILEKNIGNNVVIAVYSTNGLNYNYVNFFKALTVSTNGKLTMESDTQIDGFIILSSI